MIIRKVSINEINPAPYNPRIDLQCGDPDYEKLKKSIREFDLVEPLVWNKRTGNLVGGHQRLKILQERGDKEVEVSVVDLDKKKEKALNVALNKIQGDWDFPKLKDLFRDFDLEADDPEITGFEMEELEKLLKDYDPVNSEKELDENLPTSNECPKCGYVW